MSDNAQEMPEFKNNKLYEVKTYTDVIMGEIRHLIAVDSEGEPSTDDSHQDIFMGVTQVETPQGMLPIQFEIPASNLKEAIDGFKGGAEQQIAEVDRQIQEMIEQEADKNRIIMPTAPDPTDIKIIT